MAREARSRLRAPLPRAARLAGGLLAAALVALGAGARAETREEPIPPGARRYPANRAAELKARLLERPSAPEAPQWASQYVALPEIERLEPFARAAERVWAARIGLAAGAGGSERKRLREVLEAVEGCPLDTLALRRAAAGIARIGVIVPLTGRYERYGRTLVNGLRLAVEDHNRATAPNISLVLHDSESDPLVGARKARWLLRDHGVSVLIGEILSANTAPLAAATQVVGAVLLSPSATNERLAILGDAVFQLHIGHGALAGALARRIKGDRLGRGVAALASDAPEDSARLAAFEEACRASGVSLVRVERVSPETVDLTRPLNALRGARPAALVVAGPPRLVGIVASQLPSVWPKARVYGFEALDPEGLNAEARDALEGAAFAAPDYALLGAARDSFETRYQRAHGEAPTRLAVRGYLTGLAVVRGIEAGSLNAAMLREALRGQLYDSAEGRTLRALRPLVPAEPEVLTIRSGKAVLETAGLRP